MFRRSRGACGALRVALEFDDEVDHDRDESDGGVRAEPFAQRIQEGLRHPYREDGLGPRPAGTAAALVVDAAGLRSEVNSELNFCPNFEGLVLGCIDADFCK